MVGTIQAVVIAIPPETDPRQLLPRTGDTSSSMLSVSKAPSPTWGAFLLPSRTVADPRLCGHSVKDCYQPPPHVSGREAVETFRDL